MAYVYCRSEEARPASIVWQGSLHESRHQLHGEAHLCTAEHIQQHQTPMRPASGDEQRDLFLFLFLAKWHHWLMRHSTLQQVPLEWLVHFEKPGEPGGGGGGEAEPQNPLDIVLKLRIKHSVAFFCYIVQQQQKSGAILFLKMPVIAHISENLQCGHVKYHPAKRSCLGSSTLNVIL